MKFSFLSIALGMLIAAVTIAYLSWPPVQAAPPAPPEVKECELVNTAAVSDKIIIAVLRCQPENGAPYLINSAGFMMPEE